MSATKLLRKSCRLGVRAAAGAVHGFASGRATKLLYSVALARLDRVKTLALLSSVTASGPDNRLETQSGIPPGDGFLSTRVSSFGELGVDALLVDALERAGFRTPTCVQDVAAPPLLAGKSAVLAAETGSGKTMAYLVPIMSQLLNTRTAGEQRPTKRIALVLCPNTALCQQVAAAANQLQSGDGAPVLRTSFVSSSSPPPRVLPDIVTATPRGLLSFVNEGGRAYGQLWTREGLSAAVQHVVMDEADLLLGGGYEKDLNAILEEFKVADRRFAEGVVMRQLELSPSELARLSRDMKKALWSGGLQAMVDMGFKLPEGLQSGQLDTPPRRQYVFVAATMPALTKGDVGTELKSSYPDAVWLSGTMLHKSKPQVEHSWREVTPGSAADALVAAVRDDPAFLDGSARTLVFARDVESAKAIAGLLRNRGIEASEYHKGVSQDAREAALQALSAPSAPGPGSVPVVVVSTDAAARGIDLPGITHVVQADFASNAVDFLHRIGRTARAGRTGKVSSLYQPENSVLVAALQAYIAAGEPLEGAFSRNRSFTRKVKRYGQFVPRGEQGAAAGSS